MVYRVGATVECQLAENIDDRPIDRVEASVRRRWFKGTIKSIHWKGHATVLGMPAEPRYYIDVDIPSNNIYKMFHCFSRMCKCFGRDTRPGTANPTEHIEQDVDILRTHD